MARVFVIYGQGGIWTSYGMSRLASRIRAAWPEAVVTTHSWDDPETTGKLMFDWRNDNKGPLILIGYSLGANHVTWAAESKYGRGARVDLAVCYDPSVLSIVTQPGPNVERLLLYHNTDIEPEGHAVLTGPQVERTEISMPHLLICYSEMLHQMTLAAIAKVIGS